MSNQGDRQASVRSTTGTALSYEGDWHALFDRAGVAPGPFDGRLLAWINGQLGAAFAELNGAMNAYAANQGFRTWDEMAAFTPGGVSPPSALTEDGGHILTEDSGKVLLQ